MENEFVFSHLKAYISVVAALCMNFRIIFHIMRQRKPTGTHVEYDLLTIEWNRVNIDRVSRAVCNV